MRKLALAVMVVLSISGCAPGSESERMAGEGAKYGAPTIEDMAAALGTDTLVMVCGETARRYGR